MIPADPSLQNRRRQLIMTTGTRNSEYYIMAISYSDFLTQVRNFTEVDSNVLTDTIIGQFIRNVELDVAGKVDYDDTRKYATSSFTANKRYLVTPADFLIIRSLQVFSTTDQTGD